MASPSEPPAFTRSLKAFRDRLSGRDIETFELATYEDLKIAVDNIQKEQSQRQGLRNLNKMRPLLEFLQQYSRVIEQFVNAKATLLAFIWGPMKLCLQVASRVVDAFDSLLDAYAEIGECLPLFAGIDHLLSSQNGNHVRQILADIYEDLLKFHTRALAFFKQRTWTIAFKTAFRSFSSMYGDVVHNLRRSRELLIHSASLWHFQQAQEARVRFTEEFESQRRKDDHDRISFVVDWLSHIPCHDRHEELQRERKQYPNSTHWLFDTTQTSEWLRESERSSQILWVHGIPGAGKTFLFSSIVDNIQEKLPNAQVVYFYCKYNEPRKTNLNDILRTLIAQILILNRTCSQYLYENMIGSVERHQSSTNDLCFNMLEKLAVHHEQLFIGIDGLDECGKQERQMILQMIHNILQRSHNSRNVRVFLTSRKEKDIAESLSSAHRLELRHYHLEKDIRGYVQVRVQHLSKKFSIPIERQSRIVADITKRSHGMFLLARLIMDNLLDQDCYEDLEEELNCEVLPDGIDQQKKSIEEKMDRAKVGLDILTVAARSLKDHEIQGALSIRLEDRSIDFEKRRSVIPLEELLGPLVEVHLDESVNFVHPTARDYLLQHHSDHFVDVCNARSRLATLCTLFLTFPCFNPCLDKTDIQCSVLKGDYAFQEYSVLNWIHHAKTFRSHSRRFRDTDSARLDGSILALYRHYLEQFPTLASELSIGAATVDETAVSSALNTCQKASELVDEVRLNKADPAPSKSTPYLLSRIAEVRAILEELSPQQRKDNPLVTEAYGKSFYKCTIVHCDRFEQGFSNRRQRDEHVRLHERAFKCTEDSCDYSAIGFPTNAQLLSHIEVCHRQSPEAYTFPDGKRTSLNDALKNAIDKDDVFAVREIGAEMSARPIEETGFLFRALKRRSFDVAFILLEVLGSDELNYTTKDKRTVLHEAVQAMHMDFLKRILDDSVNVSAEDSVGRTPLLLALECNHFDAVRLLWDRTDKQPKPNKEMYREAWRIEQIWRKGFIEASSGGRHDLVGGIFSTLVEYNKHSSHKLAPTISQALIKAAVNHHESIVAVILEKGREMGIEKNYSVRLKKALPTGMEGIRMLDRPEIDVKGKTKGNALARSAQKGDEQTVIRLLEGGADINYSAHLESTALGAAAQTGNLSMVNLLLDRGADVNAGVRFNGTALPLASKNGHAKVVQILLDKGADINARGIRYGYALYEASRAGHEKVVQILLDNGADINASDKYYGSALHAALEAGHENVVQILLDNGADINNSEGLYGSVLQAASKAGHEHVVQILLDKGADINAYGLRYGSALHAASQAGHKNVIQILLDRGADIHGFHEYYGTALQAASKAGHKDVVQTLLDRGAAINAHGGEYGTALQRASKAGHKDVVQTLLDRGADINAYGGKHGTVSQAASAFDRRNVMETLQPRLGSTIQ